MAREPERYTYEAAGFNGLLLRSRKSNALARVLKNGTSVGSGREINYDLQHASGNMGDRIQYGKIDIEGDKGRITINDDTGSPKARFGNLNRDE